MHRVELGWRWSAFDASDKLQGTPLGGVHHGRVSGCAWFAIHPVLTGRVGLAGRIVRWAATSGTGFDAVVLSSIMNNMPGVLVGALSIEGAHGIPAATREA